MNKINSLAQSRQLPLDQSGLTVIELLVSIGIVSTLALITYLAVQAN